MSINPWPVGSVSTVMCVSNINTGIVSGLILPCDLTFS